MKSRLKNHRPTVLANPHFSDWRQLGQNPETDLELATMGCIHGYYKTRLQRYLLPDSTTIRVTSNS
jgi:hypothetical protein